MPGLNRDDVHHVTVPVPPLAEQKCIRDVLDSLDDAIERTEAVIEATKRLRKELARELLTRGMPGWHSEWKHVPGIGRVPARWEVVRLGDVADVTAGIAMGPARRPGRYPRPYLTVANVQADRVRMLEPRYMEVSPTEYRSRSLRAGDVMMVEGHAQLEQLGRAAVVPPEAEGCTFQNHIFRVRPAPEQLLPGFFVTT